MPNSILRLVGSLWFAAVLLIMLLFAMACATVREATHGSEQALAIFYKSWWFELLLALLAINVGAAVILRYPFSRRQIGFVVTHTSIIVILGGAYITKITGIDGQVGITEGQTVTDFNISQDTLTIVNRGDNKRSTVEFNTPGGGTVAIERPKTPELRLGQVHVEIDRYLPDSNSIREVVNNSQHLHSAVEVSFSASGKDNPVWVFADHSQQAGLAEVTYRMVTDEKELNSLLAPPSTTQPASKGLVKIEYKGQTYEFPLEDCLGKEVVVEKTGYRLRVIRYLPHAFVGPDKKLISKSDKPVNPAIEAEIISGQTKERRYAFARFPEFSSMHGKQQTEAFKIFFVTTASIPPSTPVEVLGGTDNELYVRFNDDDNIISHKLNTGIPIETPWAGHKFAVLRQYNRARINERVVPVEPIRKRRIPALVLKAAAQNYTSDIHLQKYRSRTITINDVIYELIYKDKSRPLGFSLKLDRFRIGRYPGSERPRSFESQVTITEPTTGRQQSRVISMNHPTTYAGYTFYQSSYLQDDKKTISYLSVSWDPGKPIVFTGYIALMIGMLLILTTRIMDQRRKSRTTAQQT